MRRIICLLSVVLILCACALPAFAIGEDFGAGRYATMPFDYLVVSSFGGPIDYLGRFSRVNTSLSTTISGFSNGKSISNYTYCSTNSLYTSYTIPFFPATGATQTTSVTLMAENTLMELDEKGTMVTVGLSATAPDGSSPNWFQVNSIIVTGELCTFNSVDGSVRSEIIPFNYSFTGVNVANYDQIDVAQYVKQALRLNNISLPNVMPERQLFKKLSVQFLIYNVYESTSFNFNVNNTAYGTYTQPLSTLGWAVNSVNQLDLSYEDTTSFNVGTFLGNSVGAFMETPIWGEFTLGHLLGIALTLGVLFFALKLMV